MGAEFPAPSHWGCGGPSGRTVARGVTRHRGSLTDDAGDGRTFGACPRPSWVTQAGGRLVVVTEVVTDLRPGWPQEKISIIIRKLYSEKPVQQVLY